MSVVPKNEHEIDLVKFIGRYQYLLSSDAKYFFEDSSYYKKRITKLIQNNILRRYKKYLVIADNGYNYLNMIGEHTTQQLMYNEIYAKRLKIISHIAAVYYKVQDILFTPSFEIKTKEQFTETSRRYIAIIKICGIKYLLYYISEENTESYINSIIYDIQKENMYRNVLVLVDNIDRINLREFSFGLNSVVICENNDEALGKLKYLNKVNWYKVMKEVYKKNVYLSEYNFCDYIEKKDKYISCFNVIDTEKINRIDTFIMNNYNKKVEIVCSEDLKEMLQKELPTVNYRFVDLDKFIEKEVKIYD